MSSCLSTGELILHAAIEGMPVTCSAGLLTRLSLWPSFVPSTFSLSLSCAQDRACQRNAAHNPDLPSLWEWSDINRMDWCLLLHVWRRAMQPVGIQCWTAGRRKASTTMLWVTVPCSQASTVYEVERIGNFSSDGAIQGQTKSPLHVSS